MFKRENLPMLGILGLLLLLFVGPMLIMLVELIALGRFEFPAEYFAGALDELNARFFLGLSLIAIPAALVYLVERSRNRGSSAKSRITLTLLGLLALMLIVTAIPAWTLLGPMLAQSGQAILTVVFFLGLPLIAVLLSVLIVIPELRQRAG